MTEVANPYVILFQPPGGQARAFRDRDGALMMFDEARNAERLADGVCDVTAWGMSVHAIDEVGLTGLDEERFAVKTFEQIHGLHDRTPEEQAEIAYRVGLELGPPIHDEWNREQPN